MCIRDRSNRLEQLLKSGVCTQVRELAVDGEALLALGYPSGPQLGGTLERLLLLVMDGEAENDRACLLRLAQGWLQDSERSR